MTDDDQDPVPRVDRGVQPLTCVQVQVVRRLVEQQHVRPGQQQRGQPQQHALPAGHLADGAVEPEVPETELVERGAGPLLHIPVVADGREPLLGDVARLDGVQRLTGRGDTQGRVDPQRGVQDQVLRQVADLARGLDMAPGRGEVTGDQPQQGGLAGAVDTDETRTAGPHREMEVVEHLAAVGPGEGEGRAGDVCEWS